MTTVAVYVVGVIIAGVVLVSMAWDISKAPEEKKRRMTVIYTCVVFGGVIVAMVLNQVDASRYLFPEWYEREEQRQEYNQRQSDPFNPDDYIQFNGKDFVGCP